MSDNTTQAHVHSAQFLGTAVVRAYRAESSSRIVGMRILLHPSIRDALDILDESIKIVPLTEVSPEAYAEVNYLHMAGVQHRTNEEISKRHIHFTGLIDDMEAAAPTDKRHYYENTTSAWDRMKHSLLAELD
jgi:hypothetical protein